MATPKGTASSPVAVEKAASTPGTDDDFAEMFSATSLRKTWRSLRPEFEKTVVPDVINHLDWKTTLDNSLAELSRQVIAGTYEPTPPARYELAKSKGAFRIISGLGPPEALLYRHIADMVFSRYQPRRVKGAFFSRRHGTTAVGNTPVLSDEDYEKFFVIWVSYHQYRLHTLQNGLYDRLVTTDIANYFESIQHDLLFEYLSPLGLPRKTIALLGRLLERFKPACGHSANPKIGIPVDDLDCSRQLAHVFLFEHDERVVRAFGEDRYVRWMDDQSLGVRGDTQARHAVNLLTRSLAELRLTLNSGKTKFLSPEDVAVEFHLEANKELDAFTEQRKAGKASPKRDLVRLKALWRNARQHEGRGHWDKVLKRFYGEFTSLKSPHLETRALNDLIRHPDLDDRIFKYFAVRGRSEALVELFRQYVNQEECLFEGTESRFFDACVSIRRIGPVAQQHLRQIGVEFLAGKLKKTSGRSGGKVGALLMLYWLDALDEVKRWSIKVVRDLDPEVSRAWLACCAARYPEEVETFVGKAAANGSPSVARLAVFLSELRAGTLKLEKIAEPKTHFPFADIKFFNARAWLSLELVANHSADPKRAKQEVGRFAGLASTTPEKAILRRVKTRLGL